MRIPAVSPARRGLMWLLRVECGPDPGPELLLAGGPVDLALRTDIVDGLVARLSTTPGATREHPVTVVLHRPGAASVHDEDRAWEAAVRAALAARGLVGGFRVEATGRHRR